MPSSLPCELADLLNQACSRGGIKNAFWQQSANIDWTTTAATPAQWDAATKTLSGYTMLGGAVWNELKFSKKGGSNYSADFTEDADTYANLINLLFQGRDQARSNAICAALKCCDLVLHIFDENGCERVFGIDWDGQTATFEQLTVPLKISQHTDASGDKGGDDASDLLVISGESECPPVYADIGLANFRSTYL